MFLRVLIVVAVISLVLGNPVLPDEKSRGSDSDTTSEQVDKKGKIWAVLVAGSYEYQNYRHQADICHAYQIFRAHGVPDENIIVMMYDDVASDPQNPNPGVIINRPDGPNVYKNMLKDYTKKDVTPENFLNIITGNKSAMHGIGSGKVLESGPNDHVFISMVGRGGYGRFAFPNGTLYCTDLNNTLEQMSKAKMFNKLLFYVEQSHSGSMVEGLNPKLKILAITASKPDEDSYATYWDDVLGTYLGDKFGVAWMEDIDSEDHHKNLTTETLKMQFNHVVEKVSPYSTPSQYGKASIAKDHVTDFFGKDKKKDSKTIENSISSRQHSTRDADLEAVPSQDVYLHTLQKKIVKTENPEEKQKLQNELAALLKGRCEIESLIHRIISHLRKTDIDKISGKPSPVTQQVFPCYKALVDTFSRECVNIIKSPFALRHLYKFANICTIDDSLMGQVLEAFKLECSQPSLLDNID